MNTLTKTQKEIIESLKSEFNRINNASKQTRSFNLIDIAPLDEKTKQIRQFKEEAELDARTWDGLAKGEADRIVRLLQEDLTSLVVERYGSHNGHHDLPTVVIKPKKGIVHHEYCVSIEVVVNKERVHQGHDCYYDKGVSLGYKHGDICPSRTYNTIEDLLEHSLVKEYIRMRLLSVIK